MPQVNEPGCALASPAVRDVSKMHSTPRHAMKVVREPVAQLAQLAHIRAAYVIKTASYRPEATSTAVGLLVECRGRHW